MIKMILAGSLELSIIIYQEYKQVMVVKKKGIRRAIVRLRIDVKIHICRLSGRFDHTVSVGKNQTLVISWSKIKKMYLFKTTVIQLFSVKPVITFYSYGTKWHHSTGPL